jgi:Glycosyltransferase
MFIISTRNFPPDIGGMQNLMGGLANALVNHGPVKVFAEKTENYQTYDSTSKAEIERFGGVKLLRKYRKANRVIEYIENNKNIRSVFFDHWKSTEKIKSEIIKNIPTFCLIHSKEINHPKDSLLNKRVLGSLEKIKFIISNSSFTKDLAIKIGVPNEKIHVIHPGCNNPINIEKDLQIQAEKIYKDSFPKIITVARLDRRKNHQNILMCIRNLKDKFPKIKYVSIGDGEEKNNLINLARELKIENEVVFINNINEKFKCSLIKNSNLFLMPSIIYKKSVEGFGDFIL